MPKFFVKEEQIQENQIIILGQDVNHIKKVLRAKIGDELQICNSQNGENFLCEIDNLEEEKIICQIKEKSRIKYRGNNISRITKSRQNGIYNTKISRTWGI